MKHLLLLLFALTVSITSLASEVNLVVPQLSQEQANLLMIGFGVCFSGILFGLYIFLRIKKLQAHQSMLDVSQVIFETCKTYLIQQGKFLFVLYIIVGAIIGFYFGFLQSNSWSEVLLILFWTLIGILGSYSVAWFGIRMNTYANSRMAFAALERKPVKLLNIPLDAGMSIGVML